MVTPSPTGAGFRQQYPSIGCHGSPMEASCREVWDEMTINSTSLRIKHCSLPVPFTSRRLPRLRPTATEELGFAWCRLRALLQPGGLHFFAVPTHPFLLEVVLIGSTCAIVVGVSRT